MCCASESGCSSRAVLESRSVRAMESEPKEKRNKYTKNNSSRNTQDCMPRRCDGCWLSPWLCGACIKRHSLLGALIGCLVTCEAAFAIIIFLLVVIVVGQSKRQCRTCAIRKTPERKIARRTIKRRKMCARAHHPSRHQQTAEHYSTGWKRTVSVAHPHRNSTVCKQT